MSDGTRHYARMIAKTTILFDQGKIADLIAQAAGEAEVPLSFEQQGQIHEDIVMEIRDEAEEIARQRLEDAFANEC